MTARQFQYKCDKCHRPIRDGSGFLWMEPDDIRQYQRDVRVWFDGGRDGRMPDKPRWKAHHTGCYERWDVSASAGLVDVRDGRPGEVLARVRVQNVRTVVGLVRQTNALLDAGYAWLALTDWLDWLRRADRGEEPRP
jgi:hypothetical protein